MSLLLTTSVCSLMGRLIALDGCASCLSVFSSENLFSITVVLQNSPCLRHWVKVVKDKMYDVGQFSC